MCTSLHIQFEFLDSPWMSGRWRVDDKAVKFNVFKIINPVKNFNHLCKQHYDDQVNQGSSHGCKQLRMTFNKGTVKSTVNNRH